MVEAVVADWGRRRGKRIIPCLQVARSSNSESVQPSLTEFFVESLMSEQLKVEPDLDYSVDFSASNGDQTQPTVEIQQALDQLQAQQNPKQESDVPVVPPSEWEVTRAQLQEKPHQPDLWRKLVNLAETSGDPDQLKDTYEALLDVYPNTSTAQIAYIEHFNKPKTVQYAEALFRGFLKTSPSVDLWKFYLSYVKRVNTDPSMREDIGRSYEFALNRVGQDKDSGSIWAEYIQFLKTNETSSTWEEQQKMDMIRKVYTRAVQIPLDNLETLWSDYEGFETGLNKITAKKFMLDLNPSYMQARTVLRQLLRQLGPLFPPLPPSPSGQPSLYLPSLPSFNPAERALVGAWKNYLKWEESNPLEIDEKDKATLITRIQGVYRKAVIRMRFYGEIWYMAYVWTKSVGKQDEALVILKAGIDANPSSFILNFAYAEAMELKKDFPEVHATFEKFLESLRNDLEALEARTNSENSSFSSDNSTDTQPANASTQPAPENGTASNNSSFATQPEKPSKSKELVERRTEYGLVWIMYMRFARRAEGVKSSRGIFGRARRERWAPWETYEAAALMEYHTSKEKDVASRIFEKGLETFNDEIEFVLRYLGFLISINDDNNARALFERVIPTFPPERARPLWERWARYEYQYGDLEAAEKLEKRIAEAYPNDPPIKRFAQRHTYLGTDAIAARDLGFAIARPGTSTMPAAGNSSTSLARADTVQTLLASTSSNSSDQTARQSQITGGGPSHNNNKRPPSPEYRRRADEPRGGSSDFGPPPSHKRQRPLSPPPPRDRGERWDGPPPRRRFGSPAWDRDRDRDGPPRRDRERDEEKPSLPAVISWFVGQLPKPVEFDGPVFRTDDLMMLFRNAVIPSSNRRPSPPPIPSRGGGRPPPDYGPYQGPGGGRSGGRRY